MRTILITYTLYGTVHSMEWANVHQSHVATPELLAEYVHMVLDYNFPEAYMSGDISILSVTLI